MVVAFPTRLYGEHATSHFQEYQMPLLHQFTTNGTNFSEENYPDIALEGYNYLGDYQNIKILGFHKEESILVVFASVEVISCLILHVDIENRIIRNVGVTTVATFTPLAHGFYSNFKVP